MNIIFATKNPAKQREIMEIMAGSGIDIISMAEAGVDIDIIEDGETFADNAIIKARAIMSATGVPAMADDSGLEIDYLNGAPGVYSARFMGETTGYDVKNARILELLAEAPIESRGARFVCAIAAAFPDSFKIKDHILVETAVIEGFIATRSMGDNGFGYDPIFFVPEYGLTTAQMSRELKNQISHRGKALRLMRDRLMSAFPPTAF